MFTERRPADAFVAWQRGPEAEDHYAGHRVEIWEIHDGVIPTTGSYDMSATVGEPSHYDELALWDPEGDPEREPVVSPTRDGGFFVEAWGCTSEEARERRDAAMEKIAEEAEGRRS